MADPGWEFYGWRINDEITITDTLLVLTMNQDYEIGLMFLLEHYSMVCTTSAGGTVSGIVNNVTYGDIITIEATPKSGWQFVEWIGDVTGSVNPYNITIREDVKFGAVFERI
jgi:hypothetical protein